MPKELPGFYYDTEKNRYFPIKGPIPGSSRKSASAQNQTPEQQPPQVKGGPFRRRIRNSKLLQDRELLGNVMSIRNNWNGSFQEECMKNLVSRPAFWTYPGTEGIAHAAVGLAHVNVETHMGECGTEVLLTGGWNCSLSLFEIGKFGGYFDHGVKLPARRVLPGAKVSYGETDARNYIRQVNGAILTAPSNISSINMPKLHMDNGVTNAAFALVTTLGSESTGGSLQVLNLAGRMDLASSFPDLKEVYQPHHTIWTAVCDFSSNKAFVGTDCGVAMVDLEYQKKSIVCHSKSDVFSLQHIQKENVMLCGFRNGSIVTVDAREMQTQSFAHQIPCPYHKLCETSRGIFSTKTRRRFQFGRNIHPGCTVGMPSAISCLASLELYDQYFLASSMDGSIKLYDNRQAQKGAVQSYEGHVNSHSRIQLGVDPYERFVVSGGEDGKVRIWSIKSGQLLFEDKISNGTPSTVCWQLGERLPASLVGSSMDNGSRSQQDYKWGAWLGSENGLHWMEFL